MKHLEEKILAYLDGSLGATEREEVLREVSASPEGRRMLEEHLRVNSLLTQAAKPTSAPLAAQRDLASKIPMMTTFLPYLAPETPRRAAAAWYRSTKYIATALGGAAIIGGTLWYALSNSNNSGESPSLPRTAERTVVAPNQTSNDHAQPLQSTDNVASNAASGSTALKGIDSHRSIQSVSGTSASHSTNTAAETKHVRSHHTVADNIGSTDHASAHKSIAQAAQKPEAPASHQSALPEQNESATEPPSAPLHSVSVSNTPAQSSSHHDLPRFLADYQSPSYIPMRAFFNYQRRNVTLPNSNLTKYTTDADSGVLATSEMAGGFELGIDYELSPWFSVGMRGGNSSFYRLQPYVYHTYHGDLDQWVSDAYVKRETAYWSGLALRYEFNPQDKLRVAASVVGGAAFTSGSLSPMGMAELSTAYSLFSSLALEAAISVDGAKVTALSDAKPAEIHGYPIGYVSRGPSLISMTQTALGARFGIVFHP